MSYYYLILIYFIYKLIQILFNYYNKYLILNNFLIFIIFHISSLNNFSKYLNILKNIIGEINLTNDILKFGYIIPNYLCHNHPIKEYYFDLSSILALSDEITTSLIICCDKTFRPGVSVSLSGELFCHDIRPGQNLLIEARVTKIGATLAFTEIYFISLKDKSTLARCSHIKYMKMGNLWDWMSPFIPTLLQVFLYFYDLFYKPKTTTKNVEPSLNTIFSLESVDTLQTIQRKEYKLQSYDRLLNYSENMHGGAIALAIQEAVWKYCTENKLPIRRIRCMEITYLSPCKGSLHISVTPYQHLEPTTTLKTSPPKRKDRSPKNEHEEENERNDSITYSPMNEYIDTFRVTIFKQSKSNNKKPTHKNQILVQSILILYENQ